MIKSNELRIGNYMRMCHRDYGWRNIEIDIYELGNIENGDDDNCKSYEPIRLTDDILFKCGFEYSKINYKFFVIESDASIGISTADNKFKFIKGNFVCQLVINEIQCLHQLQNLYFALTGNELEINL